MSKFYSPWFSLFIVSLLWCRVWGFLDHVEQVQFVNLKHSFLSSSYSSSTSGKPLSVQFQAFGKPFVLDVEQHTNLFHRDYKEIHMDEEGQVLSSKRGVADCFYKGQVRDDPDSIVLLTACDGIVHGHLRSPMHQLNLNFEPRHMHEQSKKEDIRANFQTHYQRYLATVAAAFASYAVGEEDFTHVVYETPATDTPFTCGTEDLVSHVEGVSFKTQVTGECTTSPVKYTGILVFNEYNNYLARGDQVESFSVQVLATVAAYYINAAFDCEVHIYMSGQITFPKANPSPVVVRTCDTQDTLLMTARPETDPCCATSDVTACPSNEVSYCMKSNGGFDLTQVGCWRTSNGETVFGTKDRIDITVLGLDSQLGTENDQSRLLDTFARWARVTEITNLQNLVAPFANAQLSTYLKFIGSVVGLGTVGTVCGTRSAAIQSAMYPSAFYVGSVQAHELGHNFNMQHDANNNPGYVMYASGNPQNVPKTFSTESAGYILDYFNNLYGDNGNGQPGNPTCLPTTAQSVPPWTTSLCGNGRVDPDEDCDVGYANTDPHCTSNCRYAPGSACVPSQPCCDSNGVIRSTSTICRPSRSVCDYVEYCDGLSGVCPPDTFETNGDDCTDTSGYAGVCYRGACQARDTQCVVEWGGALNYAGCGTTSSCTQTYCSSNPGATSGCQTKLAPVPDGMQCDDSPLSQCVDQACVSTSTLHQFQWVPGPWLACDSHGWQLRSRTCQDETGALANTTILCPNTPPSNRSCTCSGQPPEVGGVNYVIALSGTNGCTGALLPNRVCLLTCQSPDYVPSGDMSVNCTNGVYSPLQHYCNVAGSPVSNTVVTSSVVMTTNRLQLSDLSLVSYFIGDLADDLNAMLGAPYEQMVFISLSVYQDQTDKRLVKLGFLDPAATSTSTHTANDLNEAFLAGAADYCNGNPNWEDTAILRLISCPLMATNGTQTMQLAAAQCTVQNTWRPYYNPTPCGTPSPQPPGPATTPSWLITAIGAVVGVGVLMCIIYAIVRFTKRKNKANRDVNQPGMQLEGVPDGPPTKWSCSVCTLEQTGGNRCQACGQRRPSKVIEVARPVVMALDNHDGAVVAAASEGRSSNAMRNSVGQDPRGRGASQANGHARGASQAALIQQNHQRGASMAQQQHVRGPSAAVNNYGLPSDIVAVGGGNNSNGRRATTTGPWKCPQCTLDNSGAASNCAVCGFARPAQITLVPVNPIVEEPTVIFMDH